MLNNSNSGRPQKSGASFAKLLLIAIALILIIELGFHLILPLLGIATVITVGVLAGAWGVVVATIVFLCITGLLFFVIPGALIFLLGLFTLIWVIIAVALFPVILPIIFPMLIILVFIGYMQHK